MKATFRMLSALALLAVLGGCAQMGISLPGMSPSDTGTYEEPLSD